MAKGFLKKTAKSKKGEKLLQKQWKKKLFSLAKRMKHNKNQDARNHQSSVSKKHSIGTKIFTSILVTVFICVVLVGISSYFVSNQIIKSKVTEASEQTIIQAGDKMDFMLERYKDRVSEILMSQDFTSTLQQMDEFEDTSSFEYFSLKGIIDDVLTQVALIDNNVNLYLLHTDKERVVSSSQSVPDSNIFESEWYESAKSSSNATTWIGGLQQGISGDNGIPTVNFGQRLRIGGVQYLLVMELDTNVFHNTLDGVQFGENGYVSIVDANRNVVFSFNHDEITNTYPYQIATDSEQNMTEDNGELVFQHKSEISDWYLVGSVSEAELTKDTKTIFLITLVIIIISLLISILISSRIVKTIARPLVNVSSLMAVAQQGDLRVRSDQTKRKDEIGELAKSFNVMLENISQMMHQTRDSANKVLDAAVELTDISQMQSQSAKEVAAASEEIASGATGLTDEAEKGNNLAANIHDEVENVFHNNHEMENSSIEVLEKSHTGLEKMNQLVQQTKDGESMTSALVEKTDTLKSSTEQINDVMVMLTNIVQQTNLLSLNAAIEAARAGEAGKGFAVVADEIRKLSTQSKESIDKVEDITNGIVNEVNETLELLEKANPRFQSQVTQAQETQFILNNVGESMAGFTSKIQEVTNSIKQLRESQEVLTSTVHQVSATAEESSAISEEVSATTEEQLKVSESLVSTSDELKQLSEELQESMRKFQV
ncbi:methyl-accepting chemotaxis protein [Gracilibacillus sp. YIM 98692]|uniref:methyl-accepting chemotaxis protein n=1 Tax=Gracilibacillus sp. YIM 98692 TaxID=2663532 RepID=UPI0013D533C9|nr:methyl-accepting chemotaxis protein [Gracilibacillus sp. YIM 98692]